MSRTLLNNLIDVAEKWPEKQAISSNSGSISYASFVEAIRCLGSELSKEFPERSRALLVIENSIEYAVALYGCWYAGLIAVPTDANAKKRELSQVVGHSKPSVVISSQNKRSAVEVAETNRISFVDTADERILSPGNHAGPRLGVDDALIVYTSGTSGDPKGVVLTHHNLFANTVSIIEYLKLTGEDSTVVVLPFHYSYGNSVLHTHLFVGAHIVIGGSMMYPQLITNELRRYGVSGFSGVPTTFSLLLSKTDFSSDPPPLRYVTQAGGAMGKELTTRLRSVMHAETALFVMYGQTEASARLTWLPPGRLDEKLGSAGIAIPGVEIRILGKDGSELRTGEVGEIVACGANIMSRYWDNPRATAAAVMDGWLHTGDLGFLDADGFLFIQGRASEMIKTGAYRVSPKEIEEVISELEFVDETAVCGAPDELLGQVVVAYVVGRESGTHARQILTHCRRSLSLHKVPRDIVWKESLPKTASGKLKKRLLVEGGQSVQTKRNGTYDE